MITNYFEFNYLNLEGFEPSGFMVIPAVPMADFFMNSLLGFSIFFRNLILKVSGFNFQILHELGGSIQIINGLCKWSAGLKVMNF